MNRVLVTGASGLLGLNFCLQMYPMLSVVGVRHTHELKKAPFLTLSSDLAEDGALEKLLDNVQPDILIHCAALANLDSCEADPDLARRVNAFLPGKLAVLSARHHFKLVHISTDAVFDGTRPGYTEEDEPHPLGVYAATKLEGERLVLEADNRAIVARVNFYGWSLNGRRSLAEWFISNLSVGTPVKGFTDVHFCPLMVNDLVDILWQMTEQDLSGLYHVLSPEGLSKFEFGQRLAEKFDLKADLISPSSWKEASLKAARANDLRLSTTKLAAVLKKPLPDINSGIQRFHDLYSLGWEQWIKSFAE